MGGHGDKFAGSRYPLRCQARWRCDFMKKVFAFVTVVVVVCISIGCTPKAQMTPTEVARQGGVTAPDRRPYWPTHEWQVTTPEKQGMDSTVLDRITDYVEGSRLEVHSVVVIRHGYIVYEKYFRPPWDRHRIHNIFSCTKSVLGSLVGIAVQQGNITSLNDKVLEYFPNRTIQNLDPRKKSITLLHLLTMKGGFDWAEQAYPYSDPRNVWIQALRSNDPIQFTLDRPMAAQPGKTWAYNGGCSQIFSAIITNRTGVSTLEFAKKNLFDPLGITNFTWRRDRQGIYDAGGGLAMTPRDMAKYGYLILNRGIWEGRQLIPAAFVAETVRTQTVFNANSGYGYQSWWTVPMDGYYYASGINGQEIYVMEKQDMVVVTTANLSQDSQTEPKMRKIAQHAISACD
jgi:CubicO group peptidase (beta-lactamase class C family)